MSAEVFVIVLFALAGAYLLGKSAARSLPSAKTESAAISDNATFIGQNRKRWREILSEDRDLTEEELDSYVNFVCLENALRRSAENGRGSDFSPGDLQEGVAERDAKVALAKKLEQDIAAASAAWEEEVSATGTSDGPAAVATKRLVATYEAVLLEAGEINVYRAFRRSPHRPDGSGARADA